MGNCAVLYMKQRCDVPLWGCNHLRPDGPLPTPKRLGAESPERSPKVDEGERGVLHRPEVHRAPPHARPLQGLQILSAGTKNPPLPVNRRTRVEVGTVDRNRGRRPLCCRPPLRLEGSGAPGFASRRLFLSSRRPAGSAPFMKSCCPGSVFSSRGQAQRPEARRTRQHGCRPCQRGGPRAAAAPPRRAVLVWAPAPGGGTRGVRELILTPLSSKASLASAPPGQLDRPSQPEDGRCVGKASAGRR